MKASSLSFQAAVLLVLVGMVWGIVMAVSQDHSSMPAHAHLNLLGWVSLFLFGIFYHLHPAIDRSRVAMAQVCIWIVATIVLTLGVALVHSGYQLGDPIAGVGSVAVFGDMVLFGWIVRRTIYGGRVIQPSVVPAE
jgi:putative Mn2+ efflux pump MntP